MINIIIQIFRIRNIIIDNFIFVKPVNIVSSENSIEYHVKEEK